MADSISLDLTDIDKEVDSISLSLELNDISEMNHKVSISETTLDMPQDTFQKIFEYLDKEHEEQAELIRQLEDFERRLDACYSG
eukprot:jgi/Antlo1/2068/249